MDSPTCSKCNKIMTLSWTTWDNGVKVSDSYRCYDCSTIMIESIVEKTKKEFIND